MHRPLPLTRDILLIGGGHAHALVLRMWGMNPLPGARLTLVNPDPITPYTGMLPGAVAGHYRRDEMMIDLVRLSRFAGARMILDRVTGLDLSQRQAILASGRRVEYDLASLDIGITSDLPQIPGFAAHGVSAKPLGDFLLRWEKFLVGAADDPHLVVIGAGLGGVELALAAAHRLRGTGKAPRVTVLDQADTILPDLGNGARRRLLARMEAQGIALMTGQRVARIEPGGIVLADGRRLRSDFTLAAAGARPQDWLAQTGLTLQDGFVRVTPTLQGSDPAIFAAGDCAHLAHAPRPKAGVFAVRQAPVLFANLRAAASGQGGVRSYAPQHDYLKLVSLGDKAALADKHGVAASGRWLWRLKDRIDRKFMTKFEIYPAMLAPALPREHAEGVPEALGHKPLCGGCGAKVGSDVLTNALRRLPSPKGPDLLSGPGDDAAVLQMGDTRQVITTDHLRAFVSDPHLMARLAAIHALGDIWAMGAAPQAALVQITLPRLSEPMQARFLGEIMEGAATVLADAGAELAGGHTSMGDELTIGFTITGLAAAPIGKQTARPGDVLILTKPLGTGILLAAEMALARISGHGGAAMLGEAWRDCIASMARPLGPAADMLGAKAHAMTDVTGFGLAGHLWEMLGAGRLSARLDLDAVALLPGAADLAAQGVGSTLMPANRAALAGRIEGRQGPVADLLFDPQTCGGLLAALPEATAQAALAALRAAGEPATIVGTVGQAEGSSGCIVLV
ncbi:selenide, water dikinase SelD [Alkalilacustris brevis]|uniref:selenide, water dikinase SelD n=1 Tax=Alkalilacustris brevis TaxID=2026338 RepID=UPI000E0D77D2|nr:selenide, water dikinase SelD [Alkalilacustris brevis]